MPPTAPADLLRAKLKLRQLEARNQLAIVRPLAHKLLAQSGFDLRKLRDQSARLIVGATITGTLLLTPSGSDIPAGQKTVEERLAVGLSGTKTTAEWLSQRLINLLPTNASHLAAGDEQKVSIFLRSAYGINATPELENHRLNTSFGVTGYEQHLKRFPGDTISQHEEEQSAGIAPGLGGWGYFAPSKATLTAEDILREKYYLAIQIMYLPEWGQNTKELISWYKYRKMVMVNPANGKAVIGVVADAGPARWTGKHFGASPEAMEAIDLNLGPRKGWVFLYFVNDPEGKIPLGPLEYNLNQSKPQEV